jgi:hypothetical protein
MARNLLAIVSAAVSELGIPAPVSVVGNSDPQAQQLLALVNREGSELAQRETGWTAMRGEQLITLAIGVDTYSFPTDFYAYRMNTFWNRTSHIRLDGPMSAIDWQVIKSGTYPSGVYMRFRIMNGSIVFDPVPTAVATIAIEYISNAWCQSLAAVKQSLFLADTDTPLLPDDLLILGLKWRFLAAKGFNYSEERAAYDLAVTRFHPRDTVLETITMTARENSFLNPGLLPIGDWPGRP